MEQNNTNIPAEVKPAKPTKKELETQVNTLTDVIVDMTRQARDMEEYNKNLTEYSETIFKNSDAMANTIQNAKKQVQVIREVMVMTATAVNLLTYNIELLEKTLNTKLNN